MNLEQTKLLDRMSPHEIGLSAHEQVRVFQKRFFNITELSRISGFKSTSIRFWEQRYAKLRPSVVGEGKRRKYRKGQVVLFVALRLLIEQMGFTMEGAYRIMESADLESIVAGKEQRGDMWLAIADLNEMLQIQIGAQLARVLEMSSFANHVSAVRG